MKEFSPLCATKGITLDGDVQALYRALSNFQILENFTEKDFCRA